MCISVCEGERERERNKNREINKYFRLIVRAGCNKFICSLIIFGASNAASFEFGKTVGVHRRGERGEGERWKVGREWGSGEGKATTTIVF